MRRVILAILAISLLSGCGVSAPTTTPADCNSAAWESFNVAALPADVLAGEFKVTCAGNVFAVEVIR